MKDIEYWEELNSQAKDLARWHERQVMEYRKLIAISRKELNKLKIK